jgi:hypothetical protein
MAMALLEAAVREVQTRECRSTSELPLGANQGKAVVAQIPNVSGPRNRPKLFTADQLAEIRKRSRRDREVRLAGGEPDTVPVFSGDPGRLSALPVAMSGAFFAAVDEAEGATNWRNYVTLRSVEHLIEFEPADWISYVAPKPLLMLVGDADDCTFPDIQREVFALAGEPKKLISHPGGHFDTYRQHFGVTGTAARDWFTEHLTRPAAAC